MPILTALVKDGKTRAFIKVDNSSDRDLLSVLNSIYFCRLWKNSGLYILGIVSYCAKYLAYNIIELQWANCWVQLYCHRLSAGELGKKKQRCLTKQWCWWHPSIGVRSTWMKLALAPCLETICMRTMMPYINLLVLWMHRGTQNNYLLIENLMSSYLLNV